MTAITKAITTFDVIITCYNYRDFVTEAVDSVLAQTYVPNKIIVVDDGSTDDSQEVLRNRYANEPRVKLLIGDNGGQLVAFQRGSSIASADVLCYLDADDRWGPDYLAKIATIYDNRRDVDFVFSDINLFGNEQGVIAHAKRPVDLGYTAICTYELAYWYGAPTSALSLRRPLALRVLDLPEHLTATWRLSADNCLVFGASIFGGRKYFLPTGNVHYRIHGKNGWWSNKGTTEAYQNGMRSRSLITHYARLAGINDKSVKMLRKEFKTKINPPWSEIKRYIKLRIVAALTR